VLNTACRLEAWYGAPCAMGKGLYRHAVARHSFRDACDDRYCQPMKDEVGAFRIEEQIGGAHVE